MGQFLNDLALKPKIFHKITDLNILSLSLDIGINSVLFV